MPNKEKEAPFEGRLLFGDITITIGTSTLTTTLTDTSTCSTSTAGLSVCVASGRRRKAVSDDKLFYLSDDGDHFLPSGELPESKTRYKNKLLVKDNSTLLLFSFRSERSEISETLKDEQKPTPAFVLPLVVEPGFGGPYRQARFFVAFTTTTTTTRTTSTAIVSVTAICSSFTTWQVCGASGK